MNPAGERRGYSLHREIPSLLEEVDVLCRAICSLLTDDGLGGACFSAELLARESLIKAIVYGHHRDAGKKFPSPCGLGGEGKNGSNPGD